MKYTVIIHCVYSGPVEERYEKCFIRPTTIEDIEHDGMNFVSGAGKETYDFYIVDGLEEAILSTHFNPEVIEFEDLDEDEIAQKDEIIAKYGWDYEKGVYIKVFLQENNNEWDEKIKQLQKEVAKYKRRCELIYAIGCDYDGFDTENASSMRDLVDELVDIACGGLEKGK